MKFKDLHIISPILKALEEKNYTQPTAIQEKTIPHILDGKDVLGSAQTGTGKTAAFAIPIIQNIYHTIKTEPNAHPKIKSLIITPTRELAIQIGENIEEYGKYTEIKHTVIFGGVKQGSQVQKLKKGVHILVATPGRLLDLINQKYISLKHIHLFVLDEADRMLDMGFINDIKKIIPLLPSSRQSLFFSATMPKNILMLSNTILKNPQKIEVNPVSSTAKTIEQFIYYTNKSTKKDLLFHILKNQEIKQVLIFTRTKHGADRVVRNLQPQMSSAAIHGNKSQNQRQKALTDFKNGSIRTLIATDIAARGIDIDSLKFVINYDIPDIAETYVHRIGRSGRAGEKGTSISLCDPEENIYIQEIEKLNQNKITCIEDHPFPQTDKPMTNSQKKEWNKEKELQKRKRFTQHRSR